MTDEQNEALPAPKVYYVTLSVFRYIDVFTRRDYIEMIVESLKLYQEEYGLIIYDWIIMTNHLHLICKSEKVGIKPLLKDFKQFTTIQMLDAIKRDSFDLRKEWLLESLRTNTKEEIFWRWNFSAQAIYYMSFYQVKQSAMYKDPVRAGIVDDERNYLYSSCASRYDNKEELLTLSDVELLQTVELLEGDDS